MTPRVSVVMPVYNGAAYLAGAVESVLGQTYDDFELIAINDGSTDETGGILEEFHKRDGRLRVFDQENRGLTASLNRGCGLARGEFIARMDADDICLPDRFLRQVQFLAAYPEVVLVGSSFQMVDERGRPLTKVKVPTSNHSIQRELRSSNCIAHPTVMMRKSAYEAAGGYRLGNSEDYDLWLRLARAGALANLPEVLLQYRVHGSNYSTTQIERQAAALIAARVADETYRRTGRDPIEGPILVTPEVLQRLEIDDVALSRAVSAMAFGQALNLLRAGSYENGAQLLEMALRKRGGKGPIRWAARALCWSIGRGRCGWLFGPMVTGLAALRQLAISRRRRAPNPTGHSTTVLACEQKSLQGRA